MKPKDSSNLATTKFKFIEPSLTQAATSSNRSSRSTASFRSNRCWKKTNEPPSALESFGAVLVLGIRSQKRFGLSVLDYMVTRNPIHLLIKDSGPNVIARSLQLIAGRTAQEYNQRKTRQGAFWEDRYHATAIETDEHLHRCLVYIDLIWFAQAWSIIL